MIRKLQCIRTDELGRVIPAASELCRYAMKPPTEGACNEDKHCDRKYIEHLPYEPTHYW